MDEEIFSKIEEAFKECVQIRNPKTEDEYVLLFGEMAGNLSGLTKEKCLDIAIKDIDGISNGQSNK